MTLPRILTIMGSGETAPTMVTTHRALAARLSKSARALLLDTPYGFQENAAELADKAKEYFRTSINLELDVAGMTRIVGADTLVVERAMQLVSDSHYVFAGPGSPTYALRQWEGTQFAELIRAKLRGGGIVTFASAAALTLGRFTLPVYEIYKVGEDPRWLNGLDVLSGIGINAVVIPHYNNQEGALHDTRFCYMGERRLSMLESELPEEVYVLGVDEHTALVIDLDAESARVMGKGVVTLRVRGHSTEIPSGETFNLDRLRNPNAGDTTRQTERAVPLVSAPVEEATSLRSATDRLGERFQDAIERGDADSAAQAALDLDDAIVAWSIDTLQSDDADYARGVLRGMITKLAQVAATGLRDPREAVAPYIEVLLELRARVRADKRFDLSDLIRDRLAAIDVEVRDTAEGAVWVLGADR
jgi:cyanophycinase-like exopeptidase